MGRAVIRDVKAAYLASFSGDLVEGTFALPRFYQDQVALIPENAPFRANVIVSPPRTRSYTKAITAGIKKLLFDVPPGLPTTPNVKSDLEVDGFSEDDIASEDTPPGARSFGPPELLELSYPKTKDEQIVNTALIDFLNALIVHRNFKLGWTLFRKSFEADFGHGSFEARTDGCLEVSREKESKTYAIVEAKPMLRAKERILISKPEGAEMVAWIKAEQDLPGFVRSCGRRVLVSQDRHLIHLTFAEYDENYVKYLNNKLGQDESPGFLTMHEYGGWDTTKAADMQYLGPILLAIALRAEMEQKTPTPKK